MSACCYAFRTAAALLLLVPLLVPAALAATITVDTSGDDDTVNNNCTLREALEAAATDRAVDGCAAGNGPDRITFRPTLQGATIQLALGELVAEGAVQVDGTRLDLTVDAQGASRAFRIAPGATVELLGLTITDGNEGLGGGLYNEGTLTLRGMRVTNNAAADGGGIYNAGATLTVEQSSIRQNVANFGGDGGGLFNDAGTVQCIDVVVEANSTESAGGGIFNNRGTFEAARSTFAGNEADDGGGLFSTGGTLTLVNSTVSENTVADDGGGLHVESASLTQSTVGGNTAASDGGGLYADGGTVTLTQSTVSSNQASNRTGGLYARTTTTVITGGTIISGNAGSVLEQDFRHEGSAATSLGANLVGDTNVAAALNQPGDLALVMDPLLASLADNGGPTQTMLPLPGSPALDASHPVVCGAFHADQRGEAFPRRTDGDADGTATCDIGAVEAAPGTAQPGLTLLFEAPPQFEASTARSFLQRSAVASELDATGDGIAELVLFQTDAQGAPLAIVILDGSSNVPLANYDAGEVLAVIGGGEDSAEAASFLGFIAFDDDAEPEALFAAEGAVVVDLDGTERFATTSEQRYAGRVDMNADGRADLVLYDTAQQVVQVWGWVGGAASTGTDS